MMNTWIDAETRTPKPFDDLVLVYAVNEAGERDYSVGYFDGEDWYISNDEYTNSDRVLFWMPLPEPPEAD